MYNPAGGINRIKIAENPGKYARVFFIFDESIMYGPTGRKRKLFKEEREL